MLEKEPTDKFNTQFNENKSTALWLPDDKTQARQFFSHIKEILQRSTHQTITVIYTTNQLDDLALTLPEKDTLDEEDPFWWRTPPPELWSIQPATPHARCLRAPANPEGKTPRTSTVRLYILTFKNK